MQLMVSCAKVSKSGFYKWKDRGPSETSRRRANLGRQIIALFEASDGTYGYGRIHLDLPRSGNRADGTVRQLMRVLGLVPCQPRPFRPITTIAGDTGETPDLVRRDTSRPLPREPSWSAGAITANPETSSRRPADQRGIRGERGGLPGSATPRQCRRPVPGGPDGPAARRRRSRLSILDRSRCRPPKLPRLERDRGGLGSAAL
jgi:hypothetical protein